MTPEDVIVKEIRQWRKGAVFSREDIKAVAKYDGLYHILCMASHNEQCLIIDRHAERLPLNRHLHDGNVWRVI